MRIYQMIYGQPVKKIMIFGRPGSGKSTFSLWLSWALDLPLHHLDKHFFETNWVERNYNEFLEIQQRIVNYNSWIIDGNSIRSLEMRWRKADLILYFNFAKPVCLLRILHRCFKPNTLIDDKALGCREVLRWPLVKYMWNFEKRVVKDIALLRKQYPLALFKEIKNDNDVCALKQEIMNQN